MAAKSLLGLLSGGLAELANVFDPAELLQAPELAPDGDLEAPMWFPSRDFSAELGRGILSQLRSWPEWKDAGPIALGSWARGELCPASDLDLLFSGDELAAAAVTRRLQEQGAKVRARVPENANNWSDGVEPFDVLALLRARPFTRLAAEKLRTQQSLIRKSGEARARLLLAAMSKERVERERRYDSVSSFLEPNLKYGHGGLRDLEQALTASRLFPERFPRNLHALDVLVYYKSFFLTCRQKLHLSDSPGDVLVAGEQSALAEWFGYSSPRDFMRQIERGLSRVSFYADWIFERSTSAPARLRAVEMRKLASPIDLMRAVKGDPSILMQARVRDRLEPVFGPPQPARGRILKATQWKTIGAALRSALLPSTPEAAAIAIFRSRLIDRTVPEFARIVGHVQHDQYHRFSVDAHILQAVREAKRAFRTPREAGRLATTLKRVDRKGWESIGWGALFHDLAKGLDGHHAELGAELARKSLTRFGLSTEMIEDVVWIVERHLALSEAAFRRNPLSPDTWSALDRAGVSGRRLDILAAFTYVDIRATNPDAWTPWKERLLADLVEALRSPKASAAVGFFAAAESKGLPHDSDLIRGLDPALIALLPREVLLDDLARVIALTGDSAASIVSLPPLAIRGRDGHAWIRLHERIDKPGLFYEFVEKLRAAGLGVRHASAQTDPAIGAYDWFQTKSVKSAKQIENLLKTPHVLSEGPSAIAAKFDSVDVVSVSPVEWTFSFRGKDHAGALSAAARALFKAGLAIRWARVHTWGRQIDDVFGVEPAERPAKEVEAELRRTVNALPRGAQSSF